MPLYIHETNDDDQCDAFYGPFPEAELDIRINDDYAEALSMLGGDLEVMEMSEEEASQLHINPPSFWMEQLARLTE